MSKTIKLVAAAFAFSLLGVFTGCKDQVAEDTAAMRAMMEKKQAEEAAQKKKSAEWSAAAKAALDKP